jgi:hypothetical protein
MVLRVSLEMTLEKDAKTRHIGKSKDRDDMQTQSCRTSNAYTADVSKMKLKKLLKQYQLVKKNGKDC